MRVTACTHNRTELRWKNRSINMIGRQCLDCLERVGNWPSHVDVVSERGHLNGMRDWDDGSLPTVKAARFDAGNAIERFVDTREYREYLASPEWKRRRQKVIDRAKGICEGCLTQGAEQVHHRTYAHFRNEFAFELLALCEDCHRRWHGEAK